MLQVFKTEKVLEVDSLFWTHWYIFLANIVGTQILVRDGLFERPSLIGTAHHIFYKIL